MAHGQERIEGHDQSAVCEIWIVAVGKRRTLDADRARRRASTDCFQGGSAGLETKAVFETVDNKILRWIALNSAGVPDGAGEDCLFLNPPIIVQLKRL